MRFRGFLPLGLFASVRAVQELAQTMNKVSLRVILMNILGLCFQECSIADKPMFIFVLVCGAGHFNFL
jgi:hypothetical protein